MSNKIRPQNKGKLKVENNERHERQETEVNENNLPSKAAAIHEIIRVDGEKELERDSFALLLSAVAAGLSMGASLMAKAFSTQNCRRLRSVFSWKTSAIPLVLLLSLWRANSFLLKIPSLPYCQ